MALLDLLTRANGGPVRAQGENGADVPKNGSHKSAAVETSPSRGQNLEFAEKNTENSEKSDFMEENIEKNTPENFPGKNPRKRLPGFNSALRAGAARDSAPLAIENTRKKEKSQRGVGGSPLSRGTELSPPPIPQVRGRGKDASRQLIADLSAQVRDRVSAESLIDTLVEVQSGLRPIPRRMQHPLTGEIYLEEGGDAPKAADRIAAVLALKTWGWGKDPVILDVDKQVSVSVGVDVNRLSARDAKAFLELSRKVRGQAPALPAAETTVEGQFREATLPDPAKAD